MTLGTSHGGNISFAKFIRGRLGLPNGSVDHRLLLSMGATLAGQVARAFDARGPMTTITTACASSTNSVGLAADWIRNGRADVMLCGGADLFTELSFSGFSALGVMARGTCRPLDRDRDGMMLGDGAAMLLLESEERAMRRGARVYAELAGYALGNDAHHATGPEPEGRVAARVMTEALDASAVAPKEIDYINLHGTGTPLNDEAELRAVRGVFGERARDMPDQLDQIADRTHAGRRREASSSWPPCWVWTAVGCPPQLILIRRWMSLPIGRTCAIVRVRRRYGQRCRIRSASPATSRPS